MSKKVEQIQICGPRGDVLVKGAGLSLDSCQADPAGQPTIAQTKPLPSAGPGLIIIPSAVSFLSSSQSYTKGERGFWDGKNCDPLSEAWSDENERHLWKTENIAVCRLNSTFCYSRWTRWICRSSFISRTARIIGRVDTRPSSHADFLLGSLTSTGIDIKHQAQRCFMSLGLMDRFTIGGMSIADSL